MIISKNDRMLSVRFYSLEHLHFRDQRSFTPKYKVECLVNFHYISHFHSFTAIKPYLFKSFHSFGTRYCNATQTRLVLRKLFQKESKCQTFQIWMGLFGVFVFARNTLSTAIIYDSPHKRRGSDLN